MIFHCDSCGYETSTQAKFCLKCGAPMPTVAPEAPVQNAAQPVVQPINVVNSQQGGSSPAGSTPQPDPITPNQPFGTVTVTFTPPPPPHVQRPAQSSVNVSVTSASAAKAGSKMGLIIGGLVVVAGAIGAFMFLGKGDSAPASSNSAPAERSNSTAANQPVTAKDELNILLGLVRDGRWKEATPKIQQLKSLSQVAAGDRQAATVPYIEGSQLLNDNNLQGAATAFEKAISADASFEAPRFGLARSYSRSGKLDTAAAVLVDGLLIAPDSGDGWLAAAEVFAENNKDEAANASLKLALHLAQNRSTAMKFLSNANETVKSAKFKKIIEVAMPTLSGVPSK